MHRTKTEQALADQETAHADDPERAELLRRARHFKASWIELGEALVALKPQKIRQASSVWRAGFPARSRALAAKAAPWQR